MQKENLLIVIATDDRDSILKFPLLYGGVALPRGYWKRVHIMFWGASIQTLVSDETVQQKVQTMLQEGVEFSSCIVCANEYHATQKLEALGVVCNHTGELLTTALQNDRDWALLTL
ncbi:MAG: hypothetical protein KU38_06265 [Sulfurovum sp. FS08-3]|nr:MAG: hypothetical protein KU38_06265 [Sulfurovum sp. FS08-3]